MHLAIQRAFDIPVPFPSADFSATKRLSFLVNLRSGSIKKSFINDCRVEPVFITKNGQGDLAVMSIEVYEALSGRQELYNLLAQSRKAVEEGRTQPHAGVMAKLRQGIANGTI